MSEKTIGAKDGASFEKLDPNEFPAGDNRVGDRLDQNAAYEEQSFKNEFAEPGTENGFSGEPMRVPSALDSNSPLSTTVADKEKEVEPPKTMLKKDLQGNIIEDKKPDEAKADTGLTPDILDGATEDEVEELKRLNEQLGTTGKSREELRAAFKEADPQLNEEKKLIDDKRQLVNYYDQVLHLDPRKLALEEKRIQGIQNKVDTTSQEFIDEINSEVDSLEANGMLSTFNDMVKTKVTNARETYSREISAFDSQQEQTAKQKADARKESLFNTANDFYKQDSFYGAKVEQNDIVRAYKTVSDNKLIDAISKDDNLAMEVALFMEKRESLKALSNTATYSDGVKAAFDKVEGASTNPLSKSGNAITSNKSPDDFIARFVK